jgi:hypothetical protein
MKNHLPLLPMQGVVIHKPQNGSAGIKGLICKEYLKVCRAKETSIEANTYSIGYNTILLLHYWVDMMQRKETMLIWIIDAWKAWIVNNIVRRARVTQDSYEICNQTVWAPRWTRRDGGLCLPWLLSFIVMQWTWIVQPGRHLSFTVLICEHSHSQL